MSGGEARQIDDGAFARLWPWLVFPLLPLLVALATLQLLYDEGFSFQGYQANARFIDAAHKTFVHFEALMVYVSVGFLHVVVCGLAVVFFLVQIRSFPEATQKNRWRLVGALVLILIAVGFLARSAALELTYRNICDLLRVAAGAPHIVKYDCRGADTNLLVWLAGIPVLAGLIAALFATAVASTAAGPVPAAAEPAWRASFAQRARMLQRGFYITSLVLVTSTITIMLFLQLPLALAADESTELAVASHAQGLAMFWGTVFTLTLIAIFAPSAYLAFKAAQAHERASETPAEARAWLHEQVFASVPKQLTNAAVAIAPLLVGPVGTLLQTLAGGG